MGEQAQKWGLKSYKKKVLYGVLDKAGVQIDPMEIENMTIKQLTAKIREVRVEYKL